MTHNGTGRSSANERRALLSSLAILVLVYASMLVNDLTWDDVFFVLMRPDDPSLQGLWHAVSLPFWQTSSDQSSRNIDFWRPVTTLLLWVSGSLFGKSAAAHHLLSILALGAATLSLRAVLQRLWPEKTSAPDWLALVFAAHPLAAEVACLVANIADHLVLACLLTTLCLLLDAARHGLLWRRLCLLPLLATCACGAKELGVVVVLMPFFAWLFGRAQPTRSMLRDPRIWISVVGPVVLYLGLRTQVVPSIPDQASPWVLSSLIPISLVGIGLAVQHALMPAPHGVSVYTFGDDPFILLGLVVFIAGTTFSLHSALRSQRRGLLYLGGWFLFLLLLLPSLPAIPWYPTGLRFPTRYFHAPLAGLLVIAAVWLAERPRIRLTHLGIAVVLSLGLLSFMRISDWRTKTSFWETEYRYQQDNALEVLGYAFTLGQSGQARKARELVSKHEALVTGSFAGMQASAYDLQADLAIVIDHDLEKAADLAALAVSFDPSRHDILLKLCEFKARLGDVDAAINLLENALTQPHFSRKARLALQAELPKYRKLRELMRANGSPSPGATPVP